MDRKIKKLIQLIFKMSNEMVHSKKSNRKKTHNIFSKKIYNFHKVLILDMNFSMSLIDSLNVKLM